MYYSGNKVIAILFQLSMCRSSTTFPPSISSLSFLNITLSLAGIIHTCVDLGPSTGAGETYQSHNPNKEWCSLSQLLPIASGSSVKGGDCTSLHLFQYVYWLNLVPVTTAARTSWLQQPYCVQKTAFQTIPSLETDLSLKKWCKASTGSLVPHALPLTSSHQFSVPGIDMAAVGRGQMGYWYLGSQC